MTLLLLFDCLSAVNVFRSESLFAHRDGGSTFYSHRCCKLGCHHIRHQRKFLRPNRLLRHLRLHRLRALPIRRQLTTLNLSQVQRWDLRGLQRRHTLTRRQCADLRLPFSEELYFREESIVRPNSDCCSHEATNVVRLSLAFSKSSFSWRSSASLAPA